MSNADSLFSLSFSLHISVLKIDQPCKTVKSRWDSVRVTFSYNVNNVYVVRVGKARYLEYLRYRFLMCSESVESIPETIPLLLIPCASPSHAAGITLSMKRFRNRFHHCRTNNFLMTSQAAAKSNGPDFGSSGNTWRCHSLPLTIIIKYIVVSKVSVRGVESRSRGIDAVEWNRFHHLCGGISGIDSGRFLATTPRHQGSRCCSDWAP